jgi:hypothetical protein
MLKAAFPGSFDLPILGYLVIKNSAWYYAPPPGIVFGVSHFGPLGQNNSVFTNER